jgi:hypothetical protein
LLAFPVPVEEVGAGSPFGRWPFHLHVDHLLVIGQGRLLADVPITDFVPAGASLEDAYLNLTESAVEYRTEGTGH